MNLDAWFTNVLPWNFFKEQELIFNGSVINNNGYRNIFIPFVMIPKNYWLFLNFVSNEWRQCHCVIEFLIVKINLFLKEAFFSPNEQLAP